MVLTLKRKYRQNNNNNLYRIPNQTYTDYDNTAGLGIALVLSYFLIIFYSLFTSWKKTGKVGSTVLSEGKYAFTISQAIHKSEKGVTFLMCLLFAALGLYVLYRKNFMQPELARTLVVIAFVIMPTIFIIFTYVGPDQKLHYPLAASIFIGGTIIQFLILNLYEKYFENEDVLETYNSLINTMVIFAILLTFILMFSLYIMTLKPKSVPKQLSWLLSDVLAISEYIHLIIYGILIFMFSTFAALPDLNGHDPPLSS